MSLSTATLTNGTLNEDHEDEVLRRLNASELICEVLVNFGVTHIFGGHGGAIVGLIDAIVAHPKLTWVYTRCEVNAAMAAMAYAKLHNRLGVCVATSGPGAGHLLSGLVDAEQDRVPLLCITGLKAAGTMRHADFQDIDQATIFRMAGIGFSESANHKHQLIPLLRNAIYLAVTSYRCAHLAIPIDVQLSSVTAPKVLNFRKENLTYRVLDHASDDQITALATALIKERMTGHHMVIFCGWRAYRYGNAIEQLSTFLNVPVITSYDGKGAVSEDLPQSFGVAGIYGYVGGAKSQTVLEGCDLVVGFCMSDLTKAVTDKSGMQIRRLIQIEEDIMTGDSQRYIALHSFESHDLERSIALVVEKMKVTSQKTLIPVEEHKLSFNSKSRLSIFPSKQEPIDTKFCHPGVFFELMSTTLDDDAILCADIGDNALWMASGISAYQGQRTLTSEHMGIMGFALNAGLAASLSTSQQVLVVAGDGGFQMSLNELATLKDHSCQNVLVVIIENGKLGRVNNETWGPGVRADGCSVGSPDFVKLFEAYGYPDGQHLTTSDGSVIYDTITQSWELAKKQGVAVIVVHQDPEIHPIMHKISATSGETQWEKYLREMNRERGGDGVSSKHSIALSNESKSKLNSLQDWIDSQTSVKVSDPTWVGPGFLSISPASVFQSQLKEMNPGAPKIFPTQEDIDNFDRDFWHVLMTSFTVQELSEVFDKGYSNGYPLRLQILVLPKGSAYKIHAHPNLELIIGMQGELMEIKLADYIHPTAKLERRIFNIAPPSEKKLKDMMDQFEHCMVIDDGDDKSRFVDRNCTRQGKCCANQIGSVHQSYSSSDEGTMVFVLWSGCHANVKLGNIKGPTGLELLREV